MRYAKEKKRIEAKIAKMGEEGRKERECAEAAQVQLGGEIRKLKDITIPIHRWVSEPPTLTFHLEIFLNTF